MERAWTGLRTEDLGLRTEAGRPLLVSVLSPQPSVLFRQQCRENTGRDDGLGSGGGGMHAIGYVLGESFGVLVQKRFPGDIQVDQQEAPIFGYVTVVLVVGFEVMAAREGDAGGRVHGHEDDL